MIINDNIYLNNLLQSKKHSFGIDHIWTCNVARNQNQTSQRHQATKQLIIRHFVLHVLPDCDRHVIKAC
ncbi:hypothetical protein [Moraxella lacunata]|uniref:hypothetical protein n=1 Tax=Moraxella lacunata TaxID=477 RepID=UPI003EDE9A6B